MMLMVVNRVAPVNSELSQGWKTLAIVRRDIPLNAFKVDTRLDSLMCRHLRCVTLGVMVTIGPGSPRFLLFQVCLFFNF